VGVDSALENPERKEYNLNMEKEKNTNLYKPQEEKIIINPPPEYKVPYGENIYKQKIKPVEETHKVILKKIRKVPEVQITDPEIVYKLMKNMEDFDREHIRVIYLNQHLKVLGIETASIGTIDIAILSPRDIIKSALLFNSNRLIVVHNHPSGETTPSRADIEICNRLNEALELMEMKLEDFIIIRKDKYYSFKRQGLL